MAKGKGFDLEDLRDQLQQMNNMGGMAGLMDKLPGMGNMAQMAQQQNVTSQFGKMDVIISSMTPKERRNPDILNGSRKRRITVGSGTTIQDLNRLLKQHKQMGKMMKKMKGKGMQNMMRGLGGLWAAAPAAVWAVQCRQWVDCRQAGSRVVRTLLFRRCFGLKKYAFRGSF